MKMLLLIRTLGVVPITFNVYGATPEMRTPPLIMTIPYGVSFVSKVSMVR